jgi:hypothetical protein
MHFVPVLEIVPHSLCATHTLQAVESVDEGEESSVGVKRVLETHLLFN